eukprot:SAG22_NODE_283_length_13027_cov_25.568535_12_plen_78_part_00
MGANLLALCSRNRKKTCQLELPTSSAYMAVHANCMNHVFYDYSLPLLSFMQAFTSSTSCAGLPAGHACLPLGPRGQV